MHIETVEIEMRRARARCIEVIPGRTNTAACRGFSRMETLDYFLLQENCAEVILYYLICFFCAEILMFISMSTGIIREREREKVRKRSISLAQFFFAPLTTIIINQLTLGLFPRIRLSLKDVERQILAIFSFPYTLYFFPFYISHRAPGN